MILLADWVLQYAGDDRRIELYWGDLSYLPPEHAVDILVVSAFPNDYTPTPTSLIGGLHRNGISVRGLSFDKERDMRDEFSCWLSRSVGVSSFQRILCIESGWRGTPPELADDLFRAIAPISTTAVPTKSVAMPLIGTGDQGFSAERILESVLMAAVGWFRRGMPIEVLKIVVHSHDAASLAKKRFIELKESDSKSPKGDAHWDVFLSYSHLDASAAEHIDRSLSAGQSQMRVFRYKRALEPGASWLMQVADAIDSARCIVSLYTPSYWESVYCKDELSAAYVRHVKAGGQILFPIYYRSAKIPSFFEALHYADCREGDLRRLTRTCRTICSSISGAR